MRVLTLLLAPILVLASTASAGAQPAQTPTPPTGNRFVAQVLSNLKQQVNITAKLRQESRLRDQKLVGSGNYWQLGKLDKRLTRWEMRTQVANQTASFLQVYDGEHLWTDRRLPSGRQVHRLDVAWLQSRLGSIKRRELPSEFEALIESVEGQGGLRQMLADLLRNFDFQAPQPIQLNGAAVHALVGQWKPEQLVVYWPEAVHLGNAEPPEWPEQIPHHVLLLVRGNMFPCVLEYRRASDAALATTLAGLRPSGDPLLRYEIFEVQFAVAISQENFEFIPGDDWTDETALVLEQLTKVRAEKPPVQATLPNASAAR